MSLKSKIIRFFKKPYPVDYIVARDKTIIFDEDVELLKYIRENIYKGVAVVIKPPTISQVINYISFENTKELKAVNNWTVQETLEKTGFYIK